MHEPLWTPSPERRQAAALTSFIEAVNTRQGAAVSSDDYDGLWRWSVDYPASFWSEIWDFCGVIAESRGGTVIDNPTAMPGARFFPDARLNYARNLLRRRDDGPALLFRGEDKVQRQMSWRDLYDLTSRLVQVLQAAGVGPGDRVAGFVPNLPESIAAMLAAASLGAVWSSCSPDFGVDGVLDRFGQIEPKVLFSAEGYYYNGRSHDSLEKLAEIRRHLPSLSRVVVFPYTRDKVDLAAIPDAQMLAEAIAPYGAGDIPFEPMPFNAPLYVMFSSGTTGKPKCIVHGAGGTLLQHLKEHRLHCDIHPDDRVFYFTTCSWMMWNWLVSALACEATVLLYDGSPFAPDGNVLWDFAEQAGMTLFGTSAKYIDACHKAGLRPRDSHKLPALRTLTSTGSPLVAESFDYVYDAIGSDLHLASISGGTDIISCFVLGNPLGPVWRGEIQARGLGMAVEVWNDEGAPVTEQKGELVCTRPFPSMPIGFWNDPDGARYHKAYFDRFPNIWCHGDFAEITERGGLIIHGRSDAVLNPGGVRIGTAEIYRQVEQFDQVLESLAIGQDWEGDVRVVLFVRLREGLVLDDELIAKIKQRIRANCTPRHVPAKIVQIADIPRTRSGKLVELAVRDVVHGRPVKNKEALANPEALDLFAGIKSLSET